MLLKSEFLIKQTIMEYVVGRIIGDKEAPQTLKILLHRGTGSQQLSSTNDWHSQHTLLL